MAHWLRHVHLSTFHEATVKYEAAKQTMGKPTAGRAGKFRAEERTRPTRPQQGGHVRRTPGALVLGYPRTWRMKVNTSSWQSVQISIKVTY